MSGSAPGCVCEGDSREGDVGQKSLGERLQLELCRELEGHTERTVLSPPTRGTESSETVS